MHINPQINCTVNAPGAKDGAVEVDPLTTGATGIVPLAQMFPPVAASARNQYGSETPLDQAAVGVGNVIAFVLRTVPPSKLKAL